MAVSPLFRCLVLAALTCAFAAALVAASPSEVPQKVVPATGQAYTKGPAQAATAASPSSSRPSAAVTGNLPSAPEGTRVQFSRLSEQEAAKALKRAIPSTVDAMEAFPDDAAHTILSQTVSCGTETFIRTEYRSHCKISLYFSNGKAGSCSATQIGANRLATAAHCIYDSKQGRFPTSVDVYCWGASTCEGGRTTSATHGIITTSYKDRKLPASQWDLAVLRTADTLAGTALTLGQAKGAANVKVRMTGYPISSAETGCSNRDFNTCNQFSIIDNMYAAKQGPYWSRKLTTCSGFSGSGVIQSDKVLVAVHSGNTVADKAGNCQLVVNAPNLTADFDPLTCEKTSGGASLGCLSAKLPA